MNIKLSNDIKNIKNPQKVLNNATNDARIMKWVNEG